jgi:hypothetical protein
MPTSLLHVKTGTVLAVFYKTRSLRESTGGKQKVPPRKLQFPEIRKLLQSADPDASNAPSQLKQQDILTNSISHISYKIKSLKLQVNAV